MRIIMAMSTVIITLSSVITFLYVAKERENASRVELMAEQIKALSDDNRVLQSQVDALMRLCQNRVDIRTIN